MGDEFRSGLGRLRDVGHAKNYAIMRAEVAWWRYHRRVIADYLIGSGK